MSRIKYGQIGVGHGHAGKIEVYRSSPEFEVVGVVELDAELRNRAHGQPAFRDLPWMTQEQLLNVPGLQVVGVETQVRDLLSTAKSCLAAGMHIHLDKPAGESLEEFKHILDQAASRHLVVQMGYMYRYNPAVVLLRTMLQKGWLGEPFEVHTVMSKRLDATGRKTQREYRGGSMFELGCHVLDLTIAVLGTPQNVRSFPRHSCTQVDDGLLDNMLAVLEYPRATATVRSSFVEVEGFARRHFVLCGTEGTFHIQPLDDPQVTLALSTDRNGHHQGLQTVNVAPYTRYVGDVADLARLVRHEKDADFSYEHDYLVQKTVLQASGMQ